MKIKKTAKHRRNFDYPEDTEGTRLAAEIRSKCNSLTDEERQHLFKKGLARINQGVQRR